MTEELPALCSTTSACGISFTQEAESRGSVNVMAAGFSAPVRYQHTRLCVRTPSFCALVLSGRCLCVCVEGDGAVRHRLAVSPREVWPECECLPSCLPFALQAFGDSDRGGMGCLRMCVWWREHHSLWERGRKGKTGGGCRKRERAWEKNEGGSFRLRGWTTAQTLQSFSFASLRTPA